MMMWGTMLLEDWVVAYLKEVEVVLKAEGGTQALGAAFRMFLEITNLRIFLVLRLWRMGKFLLIWGLS